MPEYEFRRKYQRHFVIEARNVEKAKKKLREADDLTEYELGQPASFANQQKNDFELVDTL